MGQLGAAKKHVNTYKVLSEDTISKLRSVQLDPLPTLVLSGPVAGKEIPWVQRWFDVWLDECLDFVVGSLLCLLHTFRAQLEATGEPTLLTFVTSDTSLDEIDQLLDYSDLLCLRVLDSARL